MAALLARGLSEEKYELHLGLITQADAGTSCLPEYLNIHGLGAGRVRAAAWPLLRLVRQVKPDVVLSSMVHLNFLVLLLKTLFPRKTRVLVRQNSTASAALEFGDLPGYTRLLYRLLYRRADRIVCQTRAMAADLAEQIGIQPKRLAILANPLGIQSIQHAAKSDPNLWQGPGPHLLAIGRLAPVKGFDLLLQAMVTVRLQFPQADLLIAGVGPAETALKSQCHELGLDPAVRFLGHVDRSAAYFPGASLFVLSSRHEGLPNALLEAAAGGLPIVALPASQGLIELLVGQPGVRLAPEISASALADAILALLRSLRPAERFAHTFIEEFRFERAISAYEALIDSALIESDR